jgi:hypothetical protein
MYIFVINTYFYPDIYKLSKRRKGIMKGKASVVLMVIFLVSLCALNTWTQDEKQKSQAYFLLDVMVKPSMLAAYEAAAKEMVLLNSQYNASYAWYGFRGDDFHYYFFMPVKDFVDLDNMFKADTELERKIGEEKMEEIEELFLGTYEYVHTYMIYTRPDLSFTPENPRLKPEEAIYRKWVPYSVLPDKEKEFQEILKKFIPLAQSKNVTEGYEISVGAMGMDAPQYIVQFSGKSAADQEAHYAKTIGLLGEEAVTLLNKMFACTRKVEIKTAWFRPDLSYIPNKE